MLIDPHYAKKTQSIMSAFIASVALYLIWLAIPAAIAIKIFKLFPNTQVSASGPLQGLTINVTGAFGAFFITTLLGYPIIRTIDARIESAMVEPVAKTTIRIAFLDQDGRRIEPRRMRPSNLQVVTLPMSVEDASFPTMRVTIGLHDHVYQSIRFDYPGFGSETVRVQDMIDEKRATIDPWTRKVDLGEIALKQVIPPIDSRRLTPVTKAN